jgi:hypothetical protein
LCSCRTGNATITACTRKVYNRATRITVTKKRDVLDRWAVELRRIIGEPVVDQSAGGRMIRP